MRVLISGGGTGGHVYPALAVAAQLQPASLAQPNASPAQVQIGSGGLDAPINAEHEHALLWIGSVAGMEQSLVERAGIAYHGIETGQLRGTDPLTAISNAGRVVRGIRQSRTIIAEFRPDVCLVTGGYVCAPVVMACRSQRVPVMIYLPDMRPGWAISGLSRFAQRVAVTLPGAAVYFGGEVPKGKAVVTGYPVRSELVDTAQDKVAARKQLADMLAWPLLDASANGQLPLLFVWGGSQGSRNINQVTWSILPELLEKALVLHVIGQRDWQTAQDHLHSMMTSGIPARQLLDRYHAVGYLHEEMAFALAASDLTVARAGASVLGEFPVASLPSILVPLPIAGVNQTRNANELVEHGAAVVLEDETLAQSLGPTVLDLLHDHEQRTAMSVAAGQLAQPGAAANIAQELQQLAVDSDIRSKRIKQQDPL